MIKLLLLMIFAHIVDDYYLQGILASMKQKSWWKEHYPEEKYECDYTAALWMHSFAWSFMIHIPVVVVLLYRNMMTVQNSLVLSILFWTNHWIHYLVDDLKANSKVLNLWQDQTIHVVQIFATHAIWVFGGKILG